MLFADVPNRSNRPLSSCANQSGAVEALFGCADVAPRMLDVEFLCREAFRRFGKIFPSSIWACCGTVCFARVATGSNPRFFALVTDVHQTAKAAQRSIDYSGLLIPTAPAESTASAARSDFRSFARKYLPVLLGQADLDGVSGKLCVAAARDILGVSPNFIYRRRVVNAQVTSLLDMSGSRQRALHRANDRTGLIPVICLPSLLCGCAVPCFSESTEDHLSALVDEFSELSAGIRPYETENEFIIDLLYCPLTDSDASTYDRAIPELLGVCHGRVSRSRAVVRILIANPSLIPNTSRAAPHGMFKYASSKNPMNRVSWELRDAIRLGLDTAKRADPAASDGLVSYRFYDPSVNTYGKIQALLHKNMADSLGENIGELSSTTFRGILSQFLADRDGRLSLARADHNCCPNCQQLEIAVCAVEIELKSMGTNVAEDMRIVRENQLTEARGALEEHIDWERMVRRHLKKLVHLFRQAENQERLVSLRSSGRLLPSLICPEWRSKKGMALLTHQDEMTKANIPYFVRKSLSVLARYRYDVTAHASAITGSAVVLSHEQGMGPKNSGTGIESILLDHLLMCRGENIRIIWGDCASVGRSFFSCVACMQYLVDSGLCDLVLSGYIANCHGKYLADSLFCQWRTKARNVDMVSVDGLLGIFESINRAAGEGVRGIVLNPISSVNWQDNLARLVYGTAPPPELGWEAINPHYSCACRPQVKEDLPDNLKELLWLLLPEYEGCVRITSWPYFENPEKSVAVNHRPVDIPAIYLKSRSPVQAAEPRRTKTGILQSHYRDHVQEQEMAWFRKQLLRF